MVGKILRALFGQTSPEGLQRAAVSEERARNKREDQLVDVAHEALMEEAARQQSELAGMVRTGLSQVQREQLKGQVRNKVWEIVSTNFNVNDAQMVDEITEEILGAAEVDPRYRRMVAPDTV